MLPISTLASTLLFGSPVCGPAPRGVIVGAEQGQGVGQSASSRIQFAPQAGDLGRALESTFLRVWAGVGHHE